MKDFGKYVLALIKRAAIWLIKFIGRKAFGLLSWLIMTILRFDRCVVKRYLNIETPIYKWWWNNRVRLIQFKLDKQQK